MWSAPNFALKDQLFTCESTPWKVVYSGRATCDMRHPANSMEEASKNLKLTMPKIRLGGRILAGNDRPRNWQFPLNPVGVSQYIPSVRLLLPRRRVGDPCPPYTATWWAALLRG